MTEHFVEVCKRRGLKRLHLKNKGMVCEVIVVERVYWNMSQSLKYLGFVLDELFTDKPECYREVGGELWL